MSLKKLKLKVAAAATAAAIGAPLFIGVGAASATTSSETGGNNGSTKVIALAGSDTTTLVMEAVATAYNQSSGNKDRDRVVNIPPLHHVAANLGGTPLADGTGSFAGGSEQLAAQLATKGYVAAARMGWPTGAFVPGDADCKQERLYGGEGALDKGTSSSGNTSPNGAIDVTNDTFSTFANIRDLNDDSDFDDVNEKIELGLVAPNGSGAGRSAALDETNNPEGCLDIARSSSAPSAAQQASFDTWGFALDAIGWTYFTGNTHGVTSLLKSQLTQVYTCDAGTNTPQFQTWEELGATDANKANTIKPYRVQPGSGTATDVAMVLIGLASAADASFTNCSAPGSIFPTVQEHDCNAVADADKPDAICFYGYSRWRIQASGIEVDKRNGAKFGRFRATEAATALLPTPSTINETSARYAGTRIVYNLVYRGASGSTTLPSFNDALAVVGVRPTAEGGEVGFLCKGGTATRIIRLYGLIPLRSAQTDAAGGYPDSFCRHNKYSL